MWFDPLTAWIVSLFTTGIPIAKEKIGNTFGATIPAENWANKELMDKDRSIGMSQDQIMRNVKNGRYIMRIQYPEPHREATGKKRVIIENYELHKADIAQYGAHEAYKWVDQGKYNLNAEELKIVKLQLEKKNIELYGLVTGMTRERKARIEEITQILAASNWDYRHTEAVAQWKIAHDANIGRY